MLESRIQRQTDTDGGSVAPASRRLTDRTLQPASTEPQKRSTRENIRDVYSRDLTDASSHPPLSSALSRRAASPPSVCHKHCGGRRREEHTLTPPLFSSTSSSELSFSGSPAAFEPLTSTLLHPDETHGPGDQAEGRGWGRWSTGAPSGGALTSPHKANYWACAIPKDLPPSPDRLSADWDANKEYQALLDYTYPLRTHHVTCAARDQHRPLQADMQDSGIDVDHVCSSTSLSGLDCVSFTDLQGAPTRSLTDPGSLTLNHLDRNKCKGDHHLHRPRCISTALTRSSRTSARVEEDEEFRRLPEQLSELQLLSTQVRVIAAQVRRPVTAGWSLDPGTSSIFSSVTSPEKQEATNNTREDNSEDDTEWHVPQSAAAAAAAAAAGGGRWAEPVACRSSASRLRRAEALVKQLCDLHLHQSSHEQQHHQQQQQHHHQQQSDSLLQHIQVFCSHLEQLIQYLYTTSEKLELLAQPPVDISRLTSSLEECEREERDHVTLTSCVMHSGRLLLRCINTLSPFLTDTLQLVVRECEALQSNTRHISSILVQQSEKRSSLKVQ